MSHYTTRRKIDVLLKMIVGGGAISGSLLAPNAVELFEKMASPYLDKSFDKKEIEKLLKYMERTKLIELKFRDGNIFAKSTKKAKDRLEKIELQEISITTPDSWDRKWRIVLYDIPTKRTTQSARMYLVDNLKRLDFYMVQKSFWIYPYECSTEIFEIAERLNIDRYLTYIVGEIESNVESKLLKYYNLHTKV